jgi:aromatic ring hydroxylase
VGRCLTGEGVFHEQEILCDIAGGLPATFPYDKDFTNPETADLLKKYINRNPNMPIEDQIKFWYQFIDFTSSHTAGSLNYGFYHGGGSPIMEQIAITTQYDINKRKDMVRGLAGMGPRTK